MSRANQRTRSFDSAEKNALPARDNASSADTRSRKESRDIDHDSTLEFASIVFVNIHRGIVSRNCPCVVVSFIVLAIFTFVDV